MTPTAQSAHVSPVVRPLTPDRWNDLEGLFTRRGPRGGIPMPGSSCWCMWWRQRTGDATKNRAALRSITLRGEEPGLIAYLEDEAVGWVSVARRETFGQLMSSPQLRPRDGDDGVWAIVCFYVDPRWKGRGVAAALLAAAVERACERGATAVEAYPHVEGDFMGSLPVLEARGFERVRPAGKRVVVRRPADRAETDP